MSHFKVGDKVRVLVDLNWTTRNQKFLEYAKTHPAIVTDVFAQYIGQSADHVQFEEGEYKGRTLVFLRKDVVPFERQRPTLIPSEDYESV